MKAAIDRLGQRGISPLSLPELVEGNVLVKKKGEINMPHMYILECANGSYYTGSTWNLERRLLEHQNGQGANNTRKHLPVKLVYCEEYARVADAFYREKQVQGWSRRKKQALIDGNKEKLIEYSRNYTQYGKAASTGSAADEPPQPEPAALSELAEDSTPHASLASTGSANEVSSSAA